MSLQHDHRSDQRDGGPLVHNVVSAKSFTEGESTKEHSEMCASCFVEPPPSPQ